MFPPMYPTRVSRRPDVGGGKRRRKACSTPQKQPAAKYAVLAVGGAGAMRLLPIGNPGVLEEDMDEPMRRLATGRKRA